MPCRPVRHERGRSVGHGWEPVGVDVGLLGGGPAAVVCFRGRLLELLCRGYVSFEVRDPKRRLISAAPFRDRWCTHPVMVEVSDAFRDPDGDLLTYGAASSSPSVALVAVSGSTVTVTPLSEGTATVTATATDAGGSNGTATQPFAVTVGPGREPSARRWWGCWRR